MGMTVSVRFLTLDAPLSSFRGRPDLSQYRLAEEREALGANAAPSHRLGDVRQHPP
jgi:hypothetical protein